MWPTESIESRSRQTALVEPRPTTAFVWEEARVSYVELLARVRAWTRHMPCRGERVVVYAENSPAWLYAAYAAWSVGAVLVPVDHLSTATELAYILNDCTATVVLCSRERLASAQTAAALAVQPPSILILEDLEASTDEPAQTVESPLFVDEEGLATIVYTSGTTGLPKGVMLSFGNLLANLRAVVSSGYFTPEARVLLLLPLHHVLPLAGSLMAPLFGGSTIVFATSLSAERLVPLFAKHEITTIVGVPRFYDLLHRTLRDKIEQSTSGRLLFKLARAVRQRGFSRLVFGAVHRKFGGQLRHLVCGGAALNPETAETFDVLGFYMCEGYGMTECSPMIAFPRPERIRLGSCGQVLEGCQVRIDDQGEILASGPNVMLGYWGRPDETAEVLRDGWLSTGDLGRLDAQGYLYVTGRRKEILVLASGKKVNPALIEAGLEKQSAAVREVGVFLDGDALHALLVPSWAALPSRDREQAERWLRRELLEPYNATVAPYQRVVKVTLTDEELPRTRLGKLRRHLLAPLAMREAQSATTTATSLAPTDAKFAPLIAYFERQTGRPVTTASRLQADLGLDSLGRVELSVFLERTFGVRLSESKLAEMHTLEELLGELSSSEPGDSLLAGDYSWSEILKPIVPPKLPTSTLYHWAIILLSRWMVRLLFCVKVRRLPEALPTGPFIVVANHQSYLDGLFVCAYLAPRVVQSILFYAKERHVRRRFLKFLAARGNTVVMNPADGFRGSLQQLAAGLGRGNRLLIFPEGTRSLDGQLGSFKDAYAILACELRVPVLPVVIDGAFAVLPRGRRVPRFWRRIELSYLEPMAARAGETAVAFNARVRASVETVLAQSVLNASK